MAADVSATLLRRLVRDLEADVAALDRRARELGALPDGPREGREAKAALALHHWYTALESAVERLLRHLDGALPEGGDWHRALMEEALRPLPGVRPALLRGALRDDLDDLRRFRHFIRHAYAVDLRWDRLVVLIAQVVAVHPTVRADLDASVEAITEAIEGVTDGGTDQSA